MQRPLTHPLQIGQIPFLDNLFIKNPIKIWLVKYGFLNSSAPVAEFARKHLVERQLEEASDTPKAPRRDFLNRFKEAHSKDPEFITGQLVLALTVANMFAGSDTTGITLRAVFYYLLKDPRKMEALLEELAVESKAGRFSRDDGLVQWEEVRDLPYLSAVINEALRCHPAVGLTLERMVPPGGVTLAGYFIPGGSIAGCSPWVIHQDTEVYGDDAAEFRPERWTEATPEQRKKMNSCLLSFGAGARTCVGKNISLLELYKLVPTILRIFEVRFICGAFLFIEANFPLFLSARTGQSRDSMEASQCLVCATNGLQCKTPRKREDPLDLLLRTWGSPDKLSD